MHDTLSSTKIKEIGLCTVPRVMVTIYFNSLAIAEMPTMRLLRGFLYSIKREILDKFFLIMQTKIASLHIILDQF